MLLAPTDLLCEPDETLPHRVRSVLDSGTAKRQLLRTRLSKLFTPEQLDDDHVHLILLCVRPDLHIRDRPTAMEAYEATVQYGRKVSSPSTSAQLSEYTVRQRTRPVFDGRYPVDNFRNTLAPPIELFSPSFAYFLSLLDDTSFQADNETIVRTHEYMNSSRALYPDPSMRSAVLMPLLGDVLKQSMVRLTVTNANPDRSIIFVINKKIVVGAVAEAKVEPGYGECDGDVQAHGSIEKAWIQDEVREIRDACCCPTFGIALDGPWVRVLGCVLPDKLISQPLMPAQYAATYAAFEMEHCRAVSCVLRALSLALDDLQQWYKPIVLNPSPLNSDVYPPRMFPALDRYTVNGNTVAFTYVRPLESNPNCVTFLARTTDTPARRIVVKFPESCGEEAHGLLAAMDLAPELLYVGRPYPKIAYTRVQMIVMAYVSCAEPPPTPPLAVCDAVRRAVNALHAGGFVRGNLRLPNVLVDTEGRVRLIDFDWAGKEGVAKYPLNLSPEIEWPAGAGPLAPIEKTHDLYMVNSEFPMPPSSQSRAETSTHPREEGDESPEDSPPRQRQRGVSDSRSQAHPVAMDVKVLRPSTGV